MLRFPKTDTRPWIRLDGRTGRWKLSEPDGEPIELDLTGQVLDVDLNGAEPGWLSVTTAGADWVALENPDVWGTAPSDDHKPGVRVDLRSDHWAAPAVRELRSNSRAVTNFTQDLADAAGEVPPDKAVRLRITAVRVVKVGRGSTVNVSFDLAPRDRWPDRSAFEAELAAEPVAQADPEPVAADADPWA